MEPPPGDQAVIWFVEGDVIGQPAILADRVIFGGRRGELIAVDRAAGRRLWLAQSPDSSAARNAHSNLILLEGLVVIGTREMAAFNATNGTLQWSYRPSQGEGSGLFGLTTDGATIYSGSNSGHVFAVDGRTGRERWQRKISSAPEVQVFRPLVRDSFVVVGYRVYTNPTTGGVAALDARDGRVLWERTFLPRDPFMHTGSLGHVGFYGDAVICGPDDGQVYSLSLRDGRINWVNPRRGTFPSASDPNHVAIVDSFAVTGDGDGYMRGLDARTGRLLWTSTRVNGAVLYPMTTSGPHVYASTWGGSLVMIQASDGMIDWQYPALADRSNPPRPYPAIASDTVYVPSVKGLLALRRR